ncbi:4981_t:CDS:2 [Gigaspora margarita]|uniref:4981_t:CDS:1 n=1 Tax=Gigaspora margarita TaxID=4874 RepID=A0ABN7VA59_GIGMA|nr:4981_t:CDS:2 [Gigaspora margarita]
MNTKLVHFKSRFAEATRDRCSLCRRYLPGALEKHHSKTLEERDVNTPEIRAKALVPKKRKTLDLFGNGSNKKNEEGAEISVFPGTASSSTTGSTSSDWLEIMEYKAVAETQYKEFKELKNKQVTKEETLVLVQDIEAEKTENISNNSNQKPTVQETEVVEQDIQMNDVANLLETEEAHSSLYTERVEMFVNVEPSITLLLASNKGNIAPVNLMANNRENAWKVNNTSHDQPNPINNENEDIIQSKEDDEFTKVTYSKKKKKNNNIKKDKREHSGPYKKSKTLQ